MFPYSKQYSAEGDLTLADGVRGSTSYSDGAWLGFQGVDLDATVELKASQAVKRVSVGCLQDQNAWIFLPTRMEVLVSSDGKDFHSAGTVEIGEIKPSDSIMTRDVSVALNGEKVRYLRVRGKNVGLCPPWHRGAGDKAWVFVDEIVVE